MADKGLQPDLEARLAELKRVVDRDPTSPFFAELGELYRAQGKLSEAYTVMRAGIRVHRDNGWAHFIFGRICLEMGKLSEAEKEMQVASELLPQEVAPILFLGQIQMRRRDYEKARIILVRMEEHFSAKAEVSHFRRYLEQKLIPPMDFGAPDTRTVLGKLKGKGVSVRPVRMSHRAPEIEVITARPKVPLEERAKKLVAATRKLPSIEAVLFVSSEGKILRTKDLSLGVIKVLGWVVRTLTRTLRRAPKTFNLKGWKMIAVENEKAKIIISFFKEGWLAVIMDPQEQFGSVRMELERLFRKHQFS